MSIADLTRAESRARDGDLVREVSPLLGRRSATAGVIGVVISTVLVVMAADRSIALSDESLYLLLVDDPDASIRSGTAFHLLLNPLFELVDKSIASWRIVRAFFDIGADLLLGVSLLSYLRARSSNGPFASKYGGVTLVSGITLVGFVSWSWSVNGFGYNEAGAILLTLIAAFFLQTIKSTAEISGRVVLCSIGVGVLLVGQLLNRWTAGLTVLVGLVVATLIYTSARKALVLIAGTGAGMCVGTMLVHVLLLDLGTVVSGIVAGTEDVSQGTHSLSFILDQYSRSLGLGLGFIVFFAIALLVGAAGVHYLGSETSNPVLPWALLSFAVLFIAFGQRTLTGSSRAYTLNGWAAALVCTTLVAIGSSSAQALSKDGPAAAVKIAALPSLLLLIPFAAAFGTNVMLLLVALFSAPLWVAALIISEQKRNFGDRLGSLLVVGMMILAATTPIFLYEALHTEGPWARGEQNVRVGEGRFSGLNVDQTTHDFLIELEQLRLRLEPEPTVISLWSRPGVTYALDGTGIGFPWYASRARDAAAATIRGACTEDGFVATGQVVVVHEVDRSDLTPLPDALATCGINFPDDFTLIDTIVAPGDVELLIFVDR